MARSVKHIKHSSSTRKVSRPAQGAHTNDRYPQVIAAGGSNEHVNKGAYNTNNKPHGFRG